ncbi:hypothetical protein BDZ89DRAFT_129293 [Hymenopellis radicata]|nr:hypothetical protein BDZ89DRAFT_129293 [Hymenopellis radicata]
MDVIDMVLLASSQSRRVRRCPFTLVSIATPSFSCKRVSLEYTTELDTHLNFPQNMTPDLDKLSCSALGATTQTLSPDLDALGDCFLCLCASRVLSLSCMSPQRAKLGKPTTHLLTFPKNSNTVLDELRDRLYRRASLRHSRQYPKDCMEFQRANRLKATTDLPTLSLNTSKSKPESGHIERLLSVVYAHSVTASRPKTSSGGKPSTT